MALSTLNPFQKQRLAAVVVYAVASLASVGWGLSYDLAGMGPLQARIQLGATGSGSTFLTIANVGRRDWTNVTVVVDDRYFRHFDAISSGAQSDTTIAQLLNQDRVPRATGVFFWEQAGSNPPPAAPATRHRPSKVTIVTDQGVIETQLGR